MTWLLELLDILAPVVVGIGTGLSMQFLKEMFAWMDTQNDWVKRAVVLTMSFLFTKIAAWAGLTAGIDVTTITPETMDTLLAAVIATVLHNAKQVKTLRNPSPPSPEG